MILCMGVGGLNEASFSVEGVGLTTGVTTTGAGCGGGGIVDEVVVGLDIVDRGGSQEEGVSAFASMS